TKIAEANEAIQDVLGISADQFTQIVMIAQGDFRKLLAANTSSRQEILRSIFGTQAAQDLQSTLSRMNSALNRKRDEIASSLESQAASVIFPEESEEATELEGLRTRKALTQDRLKQMLDSLIAQDSRLDSSLSKTIDEATALGNELSARSQAANRVAADKKRLGDIESDLLQAREKVASKSEELAVEHGNDGYRARIRSEIARIEADLEAYTQLDALRSSRITWSERASDAGVIDAESKLESASKAFDVNSERIKELEGSLSALGNAEAEQAKAVSAEAEARRSFDTAVKKLDEHTTLVGSLETAEAALSEAEGELEEAESLHRERDAEHYRLFNAFIAGQAHELATQLVDGEPCPVCGSIHHPNPALASSEHVDRQALDAASEARNASETAYLDAHTARATARSNRDSKEQALRIFENENGNAQTLGEKLDVARRSHASAEDALDQAEVKVRTKKGLEKELTASKNRTASLMEQLDEARTELGNARTDQKLAQGKLQSIIESIASLEDRLGFNTKQQAQSRIETLGTELRESENALAAASDSLSAAELEVASLEGERKNLADSLSSISGRTMADSEDLDTLGCMIEANREALSVAQIKRVEVTSRLSSNRTVLAQLEQSRKDAQTLAEDIRTIGRLADVANGHGGSRVSFETFLQGMYFDRVLERANRRLSVMSGGRVSLMRRAASEGKGAAQRGLDISVHDARTGKTRPATTLSGGESFKASLALALGLSDVAQEYAGGIELDAMFIDEGFGTLDDESLALTIRTLQELSGKGKLVGIISHVSELKETIDKQILVTSGAGGSTVEMHA
ncbi:MAG: SMC family ATPase, partial [Atopobiaceae bacterium]|nr:SMC family ATPase [Atopobiaceae bacterium]